MEVGETVHVPVLLDEVIEGLAVCPGGVYMDGTLGGGGHAEAILDRCAPDGLLFGLDRDPHAVARARRRLSRYGKRVRLEVGSFGDLDRWAEVCAGGRFDGVLLDLGISSDQLEDPGRGISFMRDGPLDMRMDARAGKTAADLVGAMAESEMESLFKVYGEERQARRIARAIVAARAERPITRTLELAGVVEKAVGRRGRIHPATQIFQALRIAVNDELDTLSRGLEAALDALKVGGRLAVISFHSLEDRRVKVFMRAHEGHEESLPSGGSRWVGITPPMRAIHRRVTVPGEQEIRTNSRARSAKLRVAERLAEFAGDRSLDSCGREKGTGHAATK
jgi:16S rRNA (cytosine1402-N4)-methyltransferase